MDTIREVAKQACVSTATVSRAFNQPELISAPTHKRVLETADRLNYRPLRARQRPAASEAAVSTDFVGFQFFGRSPDDPLQANAFYAPLLAGAQRAAAESNLHLLVHTTDRFQLAQQLPKMIQDQTIAGMLLVGTADPRILDVFSERVPQIVLVDHRDPTRRHDCIVSDFQDRLHGFVYAHFEAGRTIDPRFVVEASGEEDILSAVSMLLSQPDPPTALLAANDQQALAVMQVCRTLGLSIPGDLSLIGFDDIKFSAHTWPPLTTVRVPKEQLGRLAVTRLQERIHASDSSRNHLHRQHSLRQHLKYRFFLLCGSPAGRWHDFPFCLSAKCVFVFSRTEHGRFDRSTKLCYNRKKQAAIADSPFLKIDSSEN